MKSPKFKSVVIAIGGVFMIYLSYLWITKRNTQNCKEKKDEVIKDEVKTYKKPDDENLTETENKHTEEKTLKDEEIDLNDSAEDKISDSEKDIVEDLSDKKWIKVGKILDLYVYPLKSGRGIKLYNCQFTKLGISLPESNENFTLRDRMFLAYNEETGKFQTGRKYPTLLLVSLSSVSENSVKMEAVGMPSLIFRVPTNLEKNPQISKCKMWWGEQVECIDCGSDAAKWISSFLTGTDSGLRLGYASRQNHRNLINSPWNKYMDVYKSMRNEDSGIFSDLASYMLMSESSVKELNKRIEKPVSPLQFRPNIVVTGTTAFEEDNWDWIRLGENALIRNFKSCTRCKLVCVDPKTAIPDKEEPLKTLKTFRKVKDVTEKSIEGDSPKMGIYCGLYIEGKVKIGDDVHVLYLEKSDS